MSNPMVAKLIAKDLSLNRLFMAGATFAGLLSIGISVWGKVAYAAGGIMFLTVLIAYGVILPMFTILGERKEKTRLFVLSLPISRGDYLRAKVLGVLLTFLIPWTVLLITMLVVVLATPIPNGVLVQSTLIMMFAFADFSVIACATMLINSEGLMAAVIIVTNMSVTFFIVGISSLTRIGRDAAVDVANWSSPAPLILGSEIAVVVAAFLILFWIAGREPEVV